MKLFFKQPKFKPKVYAMGPPKILKEKFQIPRKLLWNLKNKINA